jgi:hypothetical protein
MRTLLASLVLGLALATASPASAQLELEPCLEDPVRCAGETVDEATDTVDETVDEVIGIVDEGTDPVDDIVDPGGGGGTAPAPSGGSGAQSEGSAPRGGEARRDGSGARGGPGAGEPTGTARPTGARRVERATAPAEVPPLPNDSPDSVRQALSGSTETLAFPLTLILVLGAFLLVQGRLDRSDPKLALAPVDPDDDILSF